MKIIVVGGVAGGPSFATRLRRLSEDHEIVLIERGDNISYASCALPYYLGGVINDRDSLIERTPAILKQKNNIDVRIRQSVTAVDPEAQTIQVKRLDDGSTYTETYDRLVLATGASPVKPRLEGLLGVTNAFTLRSMTDADRIKTFMAENQPKKVVILGAGTAGLELAENMQRAGLEVTVIDMADQVLSPYDCEIADIVKDEVVAHGVTLLLNKKVRTFEASGCILRLVDDTTILTDMTLLMTGVTPNSELAQAAGIAVSADGHIQVDDHLQTSAKNVYAIGDVVETTSLITGKPVASLLSSAANRQGHLLADIINGDDLRYAGFIGVSVAKTFDFTVSSVGFSTQQLDAMGITDYDSVFVTPFDHAYFYPNAKRLSIKLVFAIGTGKILGGQFVGEAGVDKRAGELSAAITGGLTVNDLPSLELPYSPPYSATRDPLNIAGYVAINKLTDLIETVDSQALTDTDRATGFFLDVREAGKPEAGTVAATANIPLSELRDRLAEIPADRTIFITYRKGLNPYNAARILAGKGYQVRLITETTD